MIAPQSELSISAARFVRRRVMGRSPWSRYRVADEAEDNIVGNVLFVYEVIEARSYGIFEQKCRIVVPGADLPQREYVADARSSWSTVLADMP